MDNSCFLELRYQLILAIVVGLFAGLLMAGLIWIAKKKSEEGLD